MTCNGSNKTKGILMIIYLITDIIYRPFKLFQALKDNSYLEWSEVSQKNTSQVKDLEKRDARNKL